MTNTYTPGEWMLHGEHERIVSALQQQVETYRKRWIHDQSVSDCEEFAALKAKLADSLAVAQMYVRDATTINEAITRQAIEIEKIGLERDGLRTQLAQAQKERADEDLTQPSPLKWVDSITSDRVVEDIVGRTVWDDCEHEWSDGFDSQFDNEYAEQVRCSKCGCPGERTIKTGEVFWPAT